MKSVIRVQRKEIDQVRAFLSPTPPLRRNYHRQNLQALSTLQARIHAIRCSPSPSPPAFKLPRFSHIPALVFKDKAEIAALRTSRRNYKRESPGLDEVVTLEPGPRDYVRANAISAIHSPVRRTPTPRKESPQSLNPLYGQVPPYIRRFRQAKKAEILRIQAEEEKKRHPGLRLLAPDEKETKRKEATCKRQEIITSLNKISLGASSPSLLRRRKQLEEQLDTLDHWLLTLESPLVYLPSEVAH